jgi:hypothetical protein
MNQSFVQPRFTGPRFEEHTLPVDVARDLAAYEALLIDLAKRLFLQDHPERRRAPKGFSDVHLAIVDVEDGSVVPSLALVETAVPTDQLSFFHGATDLYFTQARDLIAECIAAPESALPERFPKELLSRFNQLGRSLRKGEALELQRPNNAQTAVLNPEKRRNLVLAANTVYEREVELSGFIEEADFKNSTFRLRLTDGNQTTVQMPKSFHGKIRQSWGRNRDHVFVKGVAVYDSWERLQKILSVESLELVKNFPLVTLFDELSQLQDGWYEGRGIAPDKNKLETIAQKITDSYPEDLVLPTIVPTQEGNLLLEWDVEGDPSTDVDLVDMRASFHAFGPNNEDIEMDFKLNTEDDIESFFAFLSTHIKSRPA